MLKIDSHQHFWLYDPIRDVWISDDMRAIQRHFMPTDVAPLLAHGRMAGCVAVQADQSERETYFLLELADRYPFIAGVVGWVDLQRADISERLDEFAQFSKLKGFRHIVQGETDPDFLSRPAFLLGIQALGERGFTYDILVKPHQLNATIEFVRQFPDQVFVVNHLAKPYIEKGITEPWTDQMTTLASFANVSCKLSGMVTEADWARWQSSDFTFYVQHLLGAFGPDRLMFGSDWPVCLLAAGYEEVVGLLESQLEALSESEREAIWGRNALRVYNIREEELPAWYPASRA